MSNLDMNAVVQIILMIVYLLFFAVFAYVLWLVIRALRKYLKEN